MSKRITIRMPDDVYDQLRERAKAEQRTISNLVILLLKQSMNVARSGTDLLVTKDLPRPNAE